MEQLLTVLPNLSIGVVSVLGMIYMSVRHGQTTERQTDSFLEALETQQAAFRNLEASVRANLTDHLTKNSVALSEVARLLDRVMNKLDQ